MLSRLTIVLEPGLKFSLSGGDDESSIVGLGHTLDHVGDVVLVPWSINNGECLVIRVKASPSNVNGLSLLHLFLIIIHDVGEPPRVTTLLLGLFLELLDSSLVDEAHLVDDLTTNGGLASVNVTNEDQRCWLLGQVDIDCVLSQGRWIHILDLGRLLCQLLLILCRLIFNFGGCVNLLILDSLLFLLFNLHLSLGSGGCLGGGVSPTEAPTCIWSQIVDSHLLSVPNLLLVSWLLGVCLLVCFFLLSKEEEFVDLGDHVWLLTGHGIVGVDEHSLFSSGHSMVAIGIGIAVWIVVEDEEGGRLSLGGLLRILFFLLLFAFLLQFGLSLLFLLSCSAHARVSKARETTVVTQINGVVVLGLEFTHFEVCRRWVEV